MNIDVNTLQGITFDGHDVQGLVLNGVTLWTKTSGGGDDPGDTTDYFTVEVLSGTNISVFIKPLANEYKCTWYIWKNSIPNANKDNYTLGPFTPTNGTNGDSSEVSSIKVSAGDKLRFYRAEQTSLTGSADTTHYRQNLYCSDTNAELKIYGNIASLMGFSNYCMDYGLCSLFATNANWGTAPIIDASGLIFPWDNLSYYSYVFYNMFYGNIKLVYGPTSLPATSIGSSAYRQMFYNCQNLISVADVLPATTIGGTAYRGMFYNCKNLEKAPVIVGNPGGSNTCREMFFGCTKLNWIKNLATQYSSGIYTNWVSGVSAIGTFIRNPNVTWSTGNSGIPSGWTVQTATE